MHKIFEAIRRMFTLPARHNSLSDVLEHPSESIDELIHTLALIGDVVTDSDARQAIGLAIGYLRKAQSIIRAMEVRR